MNELLKSAKCTFTQEQLEDLWGAADDEILELVAKRNHVILFSDDALEEEDMESEAFFDEPEQGTTKRGFFSKLCLVFGIAGFLDRKSRQHPGYCAGDCAHCPPHYGYCYGRWYYGRGHTHGCEFEANKAMRVSIFQGTLDNLRSASYNQSVVWRMRGISSAGRAQGSQS